jgi:antitoxin HicB
MKGNSYPVDLERDGDTVLATFPGLEGATFGEDEAEALRHAVDLLESILQGRIKSQQDIPPPAPVRGRPTVTLPTLTASKVVLYQSMRGAGISKAELARRLAWHAPQVDRLLDLDHASRLDQIDQALAVLGKRIEVTLRGAA